MPSRSTPRPATSASAASSARGASHETSSRILRNIRRRPRVCVRRRGPDCSLPRRRTRLPRGRRPRSREDRHRTALHGAGERCTQELATKWSGYNSRDRDRCLSETKSESPSYVELLTCVDMAHEARRSSDRAGPADDSGARCCGVFSTLTPAMSSNDGDCTRTKDSALNRRTLLAALFASALAGKRRGAGATRPAAVLERRRGEERAIIDFVARVTTPGGPTSCRRASASPSSTMTARCGASSRSISSSPSRSIASRRWRRSIRNGRTKQPFKAVLEGDMKALAAAGEKGLLRDHRGDACRHDDRGVRNDRRRLARDRAASALQAALHRAGLPADAGAARLSARQRLQDLHRLRRRHRVHAAVDREGLRHSARAGGRLVRRDEVRDAAPTASRCWSRRPKVEFIDDGPGKPVGINRFIGRRPIFAFGNSDGDLQMLQWTAAGSGARFWASCITPTPSANMPTTASRTSASSTRRSTRRTRSGWTVVDMKTRLEARVRVRAVSQPGRGLAPELKRPKASCSE